MAIRSLILIGITSTLVSISSAQEVLGGPKQANTGKRVGLAAQACAARYILKTFWTTKPLRASALIAGGAPALPVVTGSVQIRSTLRAAQIPPGRSLAFTQTKPDKDYLVYVVSESADKIALIRFGPNGARIDHQINTGDMPVDIDGRTESSSHLIVSPIMFR
jgi:hypothetical protein